MITSPGDQPPYRMTREADDAEPQHPLMPPQPSVQALILADHVYTDERTGKRVIAGTFNQLLNFTFPTTFTRTACVYVAVTDVRGKVAFQLKYVDNKDLKVLAVSPLVEVEEVDPLQTIDFAIDLPPFPMPHPGTFSIDLHANGEKIRSMRLIISSIEPRGPDQ